MDVIVASQSKTTKESRFSSDSVLDKAFFDVLGHDGHDQVRCQHLTVTPSSCYDNQRTGGFSCVTYHHDFLLEYFIDR